MGTVVFLDGVPHRPEEARISVFDHGFLFGDSVYEVVRTRHGQPFLLREHIARLRRSAAELSFAIPFDDARLCAEVEQAVDAAGNDESYVRLIVTRGVGELELHPETCRSPSIVLIAKELVPPPERFYREGLHLAVVGRRRTDPRSLSPTAKTGNYLNNVLAIIEARSRGADDAVMLNLEDRLTEGTTANVFFVTDGVVRTPAPESGILEGITRGFVLGMLAGEGIPCEEGSFGPGDLREADEAFITSTTRDVMPVTRVDGARVADGRPGPVTRRLMERFAVL